MKVYDMLVKEFIPLPTDVPEPLKALTPNHLVIFETQVEKEEFNFDVYSHPVWEYCTIEVAEISYGKIALCATGQHIIQFYFRADGLTEKEIVEKFLDKVEVIQAGKPQDCSPE